MSKYIPRDLSFEHYTKLRHHLAVDEYAKICQEMRKPRYAEVPFYESLELYDAGKLVVPDKVRVIWVHDVERPSDNYLSREMATIEREYGFRTSYNIRVVCAATDELRRELIEIQNLGHEIQYQYEDLVMAEGDVAKARISFKENLARLRQFFPDIKAAFAHGVFKSGIDSTDIFKENSVWQPRLWQENGIDHPCGELYYFKNLLKQQLGSRLHYIGETTCIGGDEFAAALGRCNEGDVVVFLQHPTWWSDNYDVAELKKAMRGGVFF